jgi:tRNA threonylcarbamoyladenosine biosynthesis protein TsaB
MLLAIDTSTQMIGLALYDGVRVLAELIWQTRNHHTVELSPGVSDLLARCAVQPAQLEAIGVALGPGSFTSLRIGLALAKGMAFALKIPVIGIPTLDVLAAAVPVQDMPLAAVLQAGRGRLALVWYQAEAGGWKAQGEPLMITAEELSLQLQKPTLIAGELNAVERQALARRRKNAQIVSPARALRRPAYLAELAWERWKAGKADDVISLAPIYLHVAEPIPS